MKNTIINTRRLRMSSGSENRTERQEIESDRGRILFSAPLRRLQSKAQVFSLESNAAVRSRLTHSLEVSHVGRYIVQKVCEYASKKGLSDLAGECPAIETVIETACLLHDIGNPPFGHLGESAIQNWFTENADKIYSKSTKTSSKPNGESIDKNSSWYKDFEHFDGNPQGIRICVALQGMPGEKGFNLTYSQLAALVKYPKSSSDEFDYKKIGVFTSEVDDLTLIWKELGIPWGRRHPLVFLMEAADDIAYSLSDIEDGIEKKIVSEDVVLEDIKREFERAGLRLYQEQIEQSIKKPIPTKYIAFRTRMINLLVDYSAEKFIDSLSEIEGGNFKGIFKGFDDAHRAIEIINKYCKINFYSSAEAEDIEIAGYNIIYGLLNKFSILLELPYLDFARLISERKGDSLCVRLLAKIPKRLVEQYAAARDKNPRDEWFLRLQLIVDYVSGMTDDFALKVFRLMNGIEVDVI